MATERLSWIDVCKGIGILLVLYGHALDGHSYRYLIYAFHMPLFFFLSGILFHHKKYEHFTSYLKRDIKGLLLPYVIFAFISLILWFAMLPEKQRLASTFLYQLSSIFYANGNNKWLAFNNILWFLPCLFITKLGFWFVTKFVKTKKGILISLIIFSIIGYTGSYFFPTVKLPFGFETALTAIVFFGEGYLWNDSSEQIKNFFQEYGKVIFVGTFIISLIVTTIMHHLYGKQIDLRLNQLQNYGYFYIAALSGIFSCLALSQMINKNPILEYLGRHSMPLFVWHLIIFSFLTDILLLFTNERTINALHDTILAPLYTVISIALIVLALKFFRKNVLLRPLSAFKVGKEYA